MAQLPLPFSDEPARPPLGAAVEYLTVAEAAARLRCHERTIRRAIDRGALRAGRIRGGTGGGRPAYRIRIADLDRWLFGDEDGGGA